MDKQQSNFPQPGDNCTQSMDMIDIDRPEIGEEATECQLVLDNDSLRSQRASNPSPTQERSTQGDTSGVIHILEESNVTEPPVPPVRTKKLAREKSKGNTIVTKKTLLESFSISDWVRKFSKYLEM